MSFPDDKTAPCRECAAIAEEYRRACVEFWLKASEETRAACRALQQLVTEGSEADVDRACELLRPYQPAPLPSSSNAPSRRLEPYVANYGSSPMAELIYRKLQHQFKTGHHVKLRPDSAAGR